jgi:hypothetical protein
VPPVWIEHYPKEATDATTETFEPVVFSSLRSKGEGTLPGRDETHHRGACLEASRLREHGGASRADRIGLFSTSASIKRSLLF